MAKIIVYKSIQDDGSSYWEELYPIDVLYRWQQRLGPVTFSSQYQSSPIDLAGNELKREWLNFYDWNNRPREFTRIFAFIDPAVSQSNTADYFALSIGGYLEDSNTVYLLDLLRTRAPLEQQLDIIRGMKRLWNFDRLIIETTGQQLYLKQYVDQFISEIFPDSISNDEYFSPIQSPDKEWSRASKEVKFATLAGNFNARRVLLPGTLSEDETIIPLPKFQVFIDEWISFPKGTHDDTIDAIAGVTSSLIRGNMAVSVTEPDLVQLSDFINSNIGKGLKLTEEEQEALDDYLENGLYSIRRTGIAKEFATSNLQYSKDESYRRTITVP